MDIILYEVFTSVKQWKAIAQKNGYLNFKTKREPLQRFPFDFIKTYLIYTNLLCQLSFNATCHLLSKSFLLITVLSNTRVSSFIAPC